MDLSTGFRSSGGLSSEFDFDSINLLNNIRKEKARFQSLILVICILSFYLRLNLQFIVSCISESSIFLMTLFCIFKKILVNGSFDTWLQ